MGHVVGGWMVVKKASVDGCMQCVMDGAGVDGMVVKKTGVDGCM